MIADGVEKAVRIFCLKKTGKPEYNMTNNMEKICYTQPRREERYEAF